MQTEPYVHRTPPTRRLRTGVLRRGPYHPPRKEDTIPAISRVTSGQNTRLLSSSQRVTISLIMMTIKQKLSFIKREKKGNCENREDLTCQQASSKSRAKWIELDEEPWEYKNGKKLKSFQNHISDSF